MSFTFQRIPLGICNSFLLRGERTILIDGGAEGHIKTFQRAMQRLNIAPKEISLIVLTHGHWDHIGTLHPIQQVTGAQVAVHYKDQPWVESGRPEFPRGVTTYGKGMIWLSEKIIHPKLHPVKADIVMDDNGMSLQEYGIPAKVIYTPGHSMGHMSIIAESGEAFVGDMAMNAWFLRLTPGLPVLADDINMVVQSWKKILPLGIKQVYPAHGMDFPVAIMQKEISNFEGAQ
jgi:hydroxyacylglutathione hydrolase